jgi:hypothetical protein
LKELLKDLDSTYQRIFESFPESQEKYIQAAMHWLSFSAAPMTLGEIAEAITIDPTLGKAFEANRRLFDPRDLLGICPSLITFADTVESEGSLEFSLPVSLEAAMERKLKLAHYSVKEYLVSERIQKGPASRYYVSETGANILMARICIKQLLLPEDPGGVEHRGYPLADHASKNWHAYAYATEKMIRNLRLTCQMQSCDSCNHQTASTEGHGELMAMHQKFATRFSSVC